MYTVLAVQLRMCTHAIQNLDACCSCDGWAYIRNVYSNMDEVYTHTPIN